MDLDLAHKNAALAHAYAKIGRAVSVARGSDVAPHDEAIQAVNDRIATLKKHGKAPNTKAFVLAALNKRHDALVAAHDKWSKLLAKDELESMLSPVDAALDDMRKTETLISIQAHLSATESVIAEVEAK